jgi:hypothetical protein
MRVPGIGRVQYIEYRQKQEQIKEWPYKVVLRLGFYPECSGEECVCMCV